MARMKETPIHADALKPGRMAGKKGFAGKQALISTMLETKPDEKPSLLETNFGTVLVSDYGRRMSEREVSEIVGAPMTIISERRLNGAVGQDAADRFIAETEGRKR